ncbi:MAG: glycosyltransferase family 2 protein [Acidobacteria bacterium]|nr:glycosyltransferase family 2 protein [Acidobacteriota bacterium]
MSDRRISLAIPIYNEAGVLPELLRRVRSTLDEIPGGPHEAVLVDDGSSDGSAAILDRAAEEDPRLVAVHLSRNFGHQAALSAALDHVDGDVVVLMDGDLQDPPEEVHRFLAKHDEGYDVVYAVRRDRKESWVLRACYFLFYRLIAMVSDIRLPLDSGDFALLSRRVVDQIRRAPEHNRYLRGLRAWVGYRQVGIPVERSERFAGTPKYSTWRLIKLALDGIFAFSLVPLRLAALLGLVGMGGAFAYALYALYARLVLEESPQGFTALVVMIVFLASVQLLFLGVLGEYLGRVYEEVKRRPHYIVGDVVRRRGTSAGAPPAGS